MWGGGRKKGMHFISQAINEMIQKVDKDQDGAVNVQEFIELFKIAASDQFDDSTIWKKFARLSKVDVSEVSLPHSSLDL